jgi:hypothetical protein
MKFSRSKTIATLFALFLMFAMAFALVALPVANAHDPPWTFPTTAYVTCTPSVIGLGQYTTIVVWVDKYSPAAGGGAGQRWNGFKLDITKPDGTKETIGPWQCRSDVGSDYQVYTPDQVGTYTIVFSWPGETAVAPPGLPSVDPHVGDYFEGSTSEPAYLVVQEEPVEGWKEAPLPTEYWQRPITAANRDWGQLASNWLKGTWLVNNFQRWGTAPESSHILWTQPYTPAFTGGLNDAQWPTIPSNKRDYESPWSEAIIMNGKIYHNSPSVADVATYGYYCRDLYTGEIIWYKNGTDNGLDNPFSVSGGYAQGQQRYLGLTQGWLYHYYSVNGQGIVAYLIMVSGSTWYILDASTGNWMMTLINVPGGTAATDQDGSLLRYSYNPSTGNILCWNVSQAIPPRAPLGTSQQQWKGAFGTIIDAVNDTTWLEAGPTSSTPLEAIQPRSGYTMNVTVEKGLPVSAAFGATASGFSSVLTDENRVPKQLFGYYREGGSSIGFDPCADVFSAWLISIDEHVTEYSPAPEYSCSQQNNLGFGATVKWNKNITVPLPGKNYTWNLGDVNYDNQVFFIWCKQTMQAWCYSLENGNLLWGPTMTPFNVLDFYGTRTYVYYDKMLSGYYGGTLYCYDVKTGELLWNYNDTAPAYESPYGDNYPIRIGAVADGKVYLYSTEHSPTKPYWRPYLICVNITDGTEMWKLLDFNNGLSLADGYIITGNELDNNIYCIGKGPTATTVSIQNDVITHGNSVLVKGMVTDTSPGTEELAQTARFANGVPAIADEDMQAWMEYLYEQQAKPADATGVEVVVSVLDPNSNCYEVGRATSDEDGFFKLAFTPEVPGEYTVIASFEGSKSYYGSHAKTAINVEEAPAATPEPTPQPASVADMYFVPATIGIIIAIVVVGLILFLMLRKR